MIHIIYNEPDEGVIEQAMALDEGLLGKVTVIRDDYAVGPLQNIYLGEGMQFRKAWWQHMHESIGMPFPEVDDAATIASVVGEMRRNDAEEIWIWVAQNKHDVCGYYWILHYLREFQGRVKILFLNNLPFINEDGGIFYPQWLGEIQPKEFLKAKKLARPITPSEFEMDTDEWQKIIRGSTGVRTLEGGKKLLEHGEEFYDKALGNYVVGDWQKTSKIVSSFLQKEKEKTGDTYLLWRLHLMATQNVWEIRNDTKGLKYAELRNPGMPSLKAGKKQEEAEA